MLGTCSTPDNILFSPFPSANLAMTMRHRWKEAEKHWACRQPGRDAPLERKRQQVPRLEWECVCVCCFNNGGAALISDTPERIGNATRLCVILKGKKAVRYLIIHCGGIKNLQRPSWHHHISCSPFLFTPSGQTKPAVHIFSALHTVSECVCGKYTSLCWMEYLIISAGRASNLRHASAAYCLSLSVIPLFFPLQLWMLDECAYTVYSDDEEYTRKIMLCCCMDFTPESTRWMEKWCEFFNYLIQTNLAWK